MSTIPRRAMLAGATGVLLAPQARAAAVVGAAAPRFTLYTFKHQRLTLADLRGKVVVLNYWATWCGPCLLELPVLENYMRHNPGTDLKIFAVDAEDSPPDIELKRLAVQLSFPLVSMLQGSGYGLIGGGVPTSYVIDRGGVIRHAASGAFTDESFDALVTPLLAEAPPALTAS